MSERLFVYGTLRSDQPRTHRLLGGARFVGRGTIAGTLYDLGRYPGVWRTGRRDGRVHGEVYALDADAAAVLARLDAYEGLEFRRTRVLVRLAEGRRHRAWAYLLRAAPPRRARRVPAGIHVWGPACGG